MSFINKKYIYLIPLLAIVVFSAFREKNLNHPEKIYRLSERFSILNYNLIQQNQRDKDVNF